MRTNPLFALLLLTSCLAVPNIAASQNVIVYDSISQLEARIRRAGDTTLVINFWATWCEPCVKELPLFERLNKRYAPFGLQVVLVSLNIKSDLEKRLLPFVRERRLESELSHLIDRDLDYWMPRMDPDWDGAIPATLVIKGGKRDFHVGDFSDFHELETFVQPFVRVCPRPARH